MAKELRILIVDDSIQKQRKITTELNKRLQNVVCTFSVANDFNSAVDKLKSADFDLVILDLLLPLGSGTPSLENSRALISLMMAEQLFPSPHIIGLTEHSDAADGERNYYIENMFALEIFTSESEDWANRIAAKIQYLERSKRASVLFANNNYETDVLIISARYENEFRPISKKIKWEADPVDKSVYFPSIRSVIGRMVVTPGISLRIAYMCAGEMGVASAAAVTSHAVNVYRPRFVITLGMCCGFTGPACASPSKFGDVLIARESASWEEGKYAEMQNGDRSFRNKATVRTIDDAVSAVISACVEMSVDTITPSFRKYLNSPKAKKVFLDYREQMRQVPEIKYGMVVSGSSVVADSTKIAEIITRHPMALGLEMEIFGVYTAVQKSIGAKKPTAIGIKGVADFGDGEKHDNIQAHASILSFYTMLSLLRVLYGEGHITPV